MTILAKQDFPRAAVSPPLLILPAVIVIVIAVKVQKAAATMKEVTPVLY